MPNTTTPTPENTPIPGGGRWVWSDQPPYWRANEPVDRAEVPPVDTTQQSLAPDQE